MIKKHQEKYREFQDLIRLNQKDIDSNVDIRKKIISSLNKPVSIGYVENTIKTLYGANLTRLFNKLYPIGSKEFKDSEVFLLIGMIYEDEKNSHKGALELFKQNISDKDVIFLEQGFLASSHSWSHSFHEKNLDSACLGYVYDDISYYFMADYPNRLIHKLNSEEEVEAKQQERVKHLITTLITNKISKYNAQPIFSPVMTEGYSHRVLVCDQAYADASTIYGKIDDEGFEKMLLAAIEENPDSEIIIKTHPDTSWNKNRAGYYSHLESSGRVRVIKEPINPFSLFEHIDKVYVGTSQLGLEALFAGKEVICFGVPFYAGWGFTDDRQHIPHRKRERTLEDIFYYFYIWYTIYHCPNKTGLSQIEDVIDYILEKRPVKNVVNKEELLSPKVSIIIPVYGVEKYIEECINSIQTQTLQEIEIITVNDKSPDNSQAIIDSLAAKDKRIKPIILKENIGQGFARNIGIKEAKGDYIFFLDSDDFFVNQDILEILYHEAINNDLDMVKTRKAYEYLQNQDDQYIGKRHDKTEDRFSQDIINVNLIQNAELLHARHFWLFLYKKDFVIENDIKFITTQWEERPFVLKALLKANKVSSLAVDGIAYRVRVDSTARREKNEKDYIQQIENFKYISELFKELKAYELESEYHYHYKFTMSQYVNHLFGGTYQTVKSGCTKDSEYDFFEQMSNILNEIKFVPSSLTMEPVVVNNIKFLSGHYHLLVSLLRNKEYEVLKEFLSNKSIMLEQFFKFIGVLPGCQLSAETIYYINKFYKNDQIGLTSNGNVKAKNLKKIRVIIHIGSTKTGSTYLQHLMEENRPKLIKQGIWYPESGLVFQKNRPHKQAGHANFTPMATKNNEYLLNYIKTGINLLGNINTIVISSEAFFLNNNAVNLVSYFNEFDVSMIVYLRRQDDWANSQYCEFVSGGAYGYISDTMEEWLEDEKTIERLDYNRLLTLWEEYLPKEKIIVRPYEKEQFLDGDLVNDFANATGLAALKELPLLSSKQKNDNHFGTEHVEVLRHFNKFPFENKQRYLEFIEACNGEAKPSEKGKTEKVNVLSEALRNKLLSQHHAGNKEIANRYLGQDKLFFKESVPKNTSKSNEISVETVKKFFEHYESLSYVGTESHQKVANTNQQLKPEKIAVQNKRVTHVDKIKFKLFRIIIRPFISKKKFNKLQNRPYAFFLDSKNLSLNVIGFLMGIQKKEIKKSGYFKSKRSQFFVHLAHIYLSERKLKKLMEQPKQFFLDSNSRFLQFLGRFLGVVK